MTAEGVIGIFITAFFIVIIFYIISLYNELLNAKNKLINKFEPLEKAIYDIYDVIEDLQELFTNNLKHEEKILNAVNILKDSIISEHEIDNGIDIINEFNNLFKKISKLDNVYEDLKSNKNYLNIINKCNNILDKINYAKEFYNETCKEYETLINKFNYKMIASIFKFEKYKRI